MGLRLRFLKPFESLKIICLPDQGEKYERVIAVNGGRVERCDADPDALRLVVVKNVKP